MAADPAEVHSLTYCLKMLPAHEVDSVTDPVLTLTDGTRTHVTMHLIEGTREQIKAMLLQSVDAYFELIEEM